MKNLSLEYCQIPVGVLNAACEDWQTISKKESRATQNYKQVCIFIILFFTDDTKQRLTTHYHLFTFNKVVYASLCS